MIKEIITIIYGVILLLIGFGYVIRGEFFKGMVILALANLIIRI